MGSGDGSEAFLRQQLSGGGREGWDYSSSHLSTSKNWGWNKGDEEGMVVKKRRVMVVIDHSLRAKQAMMWALTHVANKGDLLTLLYVVPPLHHHSAAGHKKEAAAANLANSLASLCKACKPEVHVEALVIQGPKLATVLSQVRKLEASVLVLSQRKQSPLSCLFRSNGEDFVEQCINKAECLTMAVRKQSKGVSGYLVSTRWQKNFWLLA